MSEEERDNIKERAIKHGYSCNNSKSEYIRLFTLRYANNIDKIKFLSDYYFQESLRDPRPVEYFLQIFNQYFKNK